MQLAFASVQGLFGAGNVAAVKGLFENQWLENSCQDVRCFVPLCRVVSTMLATCNHVLSRNSFFVLSWGGGGM